MLDLESGNASSNRSNVSLVKISVSGTKYAFPNTQTDTSSGPKHSRLSKFLSSQHSERIKICDHYFSASDEYYFSRPSKLFDAIYDYEITGHLHKPADVCPERFLSELEFWGISASELAACCVSELVRTYSTSEGSPGIQPSSSLIVSTENESSCPDDQLQEQSQVFLTPAETNSYGPAYNPGRPKDEFSYLTFGHVRRKIWTLFEDPNSSCLAKLVAVISVIFIVMSVVGLILGSMPELQDEQGEPHEALNYAEIACIIWFTLEYLVRFMAAPDRLQFVKSFLNIIDLLTIIPFYVEMTLMISNIGMVDIRKLKGMMLVMRILRVLRVARVFKLARYSSGLQSFGTTVRSSVAELGMLGLFLMTAIIFYSTVIYFLEKDVKNTKFPSIPAACWWCVVTMTTVGYGDIVPETIGGKIVASIASISGVLVLAFPITMIVDNFTQHYQKEEPNNDGTQHLRRRRMGKFA